MEIIVAKSAGFCFGVANAVSKAMSVEGGGVTLGEIIHNDTVVAQLRDKGINPIDSLDEYNGGTLIIRSHGVGRQVYQEMDARGIKYIDATCPFVKRIHGIVDKHSSEGKHVIVTGEATHAEVVGITGWCKGGATVISSEKEAEGLDLKGADCILVSQTTFSLEKYNNIKKIIKNKCKTVEIFDTICYTTRERQREVVSLAQSCDGMLVIGGRHSSNTLKLYELSREHCKRTYLVSDLRDLENITDNFNRLGITAGASTPKELIMEVVKIMSETQATSIEMLNEEVAVQAKEEVNKNEFLAAMEDMGQDTQVKPKEGKRVTVTVVGADATGVNVDFGGGKTEAHIAREEMELDEADYNPANYQEGMVFEAEFIAKKDSKAPVAMSRKKILQREAEQKKYEEIINGGDFTVKIDKAVKGGLLAKLGSIYTVFIPQSQIRLGFEKNPEKYVGKELVVRRIEGKKEDGKPNSRKIVASHSVIQEEERKAREDAFWASMIPDTIVKGKVKRFTDFGAFVGVNGNDCLAHISDLSWVKVNQPSEVLELNKTYDFLILSADRSTGKVSLGYKQLQKKPYEEAMEKYAVGSVVKGKVERIFSYGAFVSIDRGVDGLVPVSEISYNYIKDAAEAFTPGQEIEAKVIKFEGNKITLSVKALLDPPADRNADVEITNEDVKENNERRAKANAKKFENVPAQPRKRAKKVVEPKEEEVKSWTSESTGATLGDLFKNLNFDFSEDKE